MVEAVQDVVNASSDARSQYIKFLRTAAETAALIQTFRDNTQSELVNVVDGIDGTHTSRSTEGKCYQLLQSLLTCYDCSRSC